MQGGQFVGTPDKWAPRPQPHLGSGDVRRAQPHDLVGAHGARLPWHRHGCDFLKTDIPLDQEGRGLAAEQHARCCMLLQRLDRQGEIPDDGGYPLNVPEPAQGHQARVQPQARCQQLRSWVPKPGRR